jgi:hypothetical protein
MRILHLDAGREMRGGQWQVLRLMEGLGAEGVESTLLAREGAPLFAAARKRTWRVGPLGLGRALMEARRHDLIHAHDARSHTLGAIVRSRRLVVARRVAFPAGSGWKYGRARRYLAVSEHVKSVLAAGGVAPERISVVYDGVPLVDAEPAGEQMPVLAPAAGGDPQKGEPLAREAARLAGVELKLSAELERDLRRGGIFVYITHSEGLGSGVLLAMSAGAAVIASRVGGLPEAVRHGEDGLLVENDPEAIAAAIRQLRDDPSLARRLGERARATVRERFTVERMVRRTMEVYRQVSG